MTKLEFISRIKSGIYDACIEDCESLLEDPPGREASQALLQLSSWFKELSEVDQQNVRQIIQMAIGDAIFGMLCMFDGVRAIHKAGEEGGLELRYVDRGDITVLNAPSGDMLHDIFTSQVPAI